MAFEGRRCAEEVGFILFLLRIVFKAITFHDMTNVGRTKVSGKRVFVNLFKP